HKYEYVYGMICRGSIIEYNHLFTVWKCSLIINFSPFRPYLNLYYVINNLFLVFYISCYFFLIIQQSNYNTCRQTHSLTFPI
ncbi:hypothetical protein L9F63_005023, partial [Diploptera punctata]